MTMSELSYQPLEPAAEAQALESRVSRFIYLLIALGITAAFAFSIFSYWTPIHPGVDQNGYLVGGRMFAETLSLAQAPREVVQTKKFDPHQFIGTMWVLASNDTTRFFPKYPLGLPLLYSICLWIWGMESGVWHAYLVSPICMTLAVLGVFFLIRRFAGSFGGILGMLVFATSPVTAMLANDPNSHASTVCCVVWGFYLLIHWYYRGGALWAFLGGFLVGYAATIRYSEGLLILPAAWLALIRLNWRSARSWLQSALVGIGWAVPVAALYAYNYIDIGTLTGYDATQESNGFSWKFFYDNWDTILRGMNQGALFLVFPLAIVGLVAMFWWNWRWAIFYCLWTLPCMTLYTFYYWAPDDPMRTGYLRFVLTVLPPMLVAAFWVIDHITDVLPPMTPRANRWVIAGVMLLTCIVATWAGSVILRLDLQHRKLIPHATYFDQNLSAKALLREKTTFWLGNLAIGAFVATLAGAAMLQKRIVPTLVAGIVGALSCTTQLESATGSLARENFTRSIQLTHLQGILDRAPKDSVIICRDERFMHPLQFARDYRIYRGESFDRGWVSGQPVNEIKEAALFDTARNRALIEALKDRPNQQDLTDDARRMVRESLQHGHRVFMVDPVRAQDYQKFMREKTGLPTPDFFNRYIKGDKEFKADRIALWSVKPPLDPDQNRPGYRGRRDEKMDGNVSVMQMWEIKLAN